MSDFEKDLLRIGGERIINACGIYTDLGGSILSDRVWAALTALNSQYVDMSDLLGTSGAIIAKLVGAESARATPGASAGLALATAAVMAGADGAAWQRLPDTTGLRNEIVMQSAQAGRYKYAIALKIAGAKIVTTQNGPNAEENLVRAIGPRTAALFAPAHLDGVDGAVSLSRLAEIAHDYNLPLVVDAAYQCHPPERMRAFSELGADLSVFSAKYFRGPNAGGFVCGKRAWIEIIAGLDFTRFESGPWRTFGRPFKMGRTEIAATALALEEWFAADHEQLKASHAIRAEAVLSHVRDFEREARGVCFALDERILDAPINAALIPYNDAPRASAIAAALAARQPSIRVVVEGGDILVVTETLTDEEAYIVGQAIAAETARQA